MNKNLSWLSIIVITLLTACGQSKPAEQKAPPPVAVTTYKVSAEETTFNDQYPGTITALNEVQLRAQVNGFVTAVYFKDGDKVRKGQKLYSLDQQQYGATYEQAAANLQVQKTNLLKAQRDAERYHELDKNDAIAKQQVDYADAALEAAKKQVDAAAANVRGAQTNVRYSTITAPFDGTIGISQVKVGTAVSAGQTILNTVSTDDPMAVDFAVDEKDISRFLTLQKNKKVIQDSILTISLPDQTVYPQPGTLSFIDRAVDPQTGTIKARMVFQNKSKLLRTGMSCVVRVKNQFGAKTIQIPYKAVVEQMGEYFVFVVNSDKVSQRKLVLGSRLGDKVIVKEGLEANEEIVVDGTQKLKDGSTIKK